MSRDIPQILGFFGEVATEEPFHFASVLTLRPGFFGIQQQCSSKQSKAKQCKAMQSNTKQCKATQINAKQCNAKRSKEKQTEAKQGRENRDMCQLVASAS